MMARRKYNFKKNHRHFTPGTIAAIIVLTLFSIVALFPFWTMIMMGTYSTADIYTGIKILPGNYFGENIKSLGAIDFGTYYGNSLIVAIATSALTVIVCSMAGYGFAKFEFRGKKFLAVLAFAPDHSGVRQRFRRLLDHQLYPGRHPGCGHRKRVFGWLQ